ncbi:MAG: ferrochelatase [Chlamydiales bacterium]|nr:ferrochelatase [Chlamydiales bacterium]
MHKIGILLLNTGTPRSCAPSDVKRYLKDFLMDGRVLDMPFWIREMLVKWLIVPFRYKNSARAYAKIWTRDGSPLLVHSQNLQQQLEEASDVKVALGLSYANPSIHEALQSLKGCTNLIVVPLFPQYASATSGSVIQETMRCLSSWQVIPELTILGPFANHPRFIDAWVARAQEIDFEAYDHVLFSFHGLPLSHVKKADRTGCCLKKNCCKSLHEENACCYPAQCVYTATAMATRLGIENYTICYQSRLGVDKWLAPYTIDVIKERRKQGDKRLLVFAPSFVADCLETIYELGMEYREDFLMMGGETLDLVPSLNTHPEWVSSLKDIIHEHIS